MAVAIRDTSRLKFARLITLDDVEHWELPEYPEIPEAADDLRYEVQSNDRIDLLANRFYGSADLWWIIAIANGLELLPSDLKVRSTLRVPSGRRVFTQILRSANRGRIGR